MCSNLFCPLCNVVTDKDWEDIKFGVDNQVDFYAVSFVKDAKVVHELKDFLKSKVIFQLLVDFVNISCSILVTVLNPLCRKQCKYSRYC